MADLSDLMRTAAQSPSSTVDLVRVGSGVRRRRRTRHGLTILGVAGAVGVTIVAVAVAVPASSHRTQPVAPVARPTGEPTTVPEPTTDPAPTTVSASTSQSAADAARDGVPADVAALPFEQRVAVAEPISSGGVVRVVEPEGVWIISRITDEPPGTRPGQFDGYGEVLLLDPTERTILRAFPLPDVPPTTIALAEDAVYCARQGDGGLPTSMLCRIDRLSGAMTVRIFPSVLDDSFVVQHPTLPAGWSVGQPLAEPVLLTLSATGSTGIITTTGDDYPAEATFDALTLDLLSVTVVPDVDQGLVDAFVAFAQDPSASTAAAVRFADEVSLGLGSQQMVTHPRADLADPSRWVLPLDGFAARDGNTSALDQMTAGGGGYDVSAGPHPTCTAGTPVKPVPDALVGLQQLSIQPAAGTWTSCLDWYSVDLFVDASGLIVAVTVDLSEP